MPVRGKPDELQSLPGIGPSLARDLRDLGVRRVADLEQRSERPGREHLVDLEPGRLTRRMEPTPGFTPPSRIGQIAIPVEDLDRAVGFYGGMLGLTLLFRAPPGLAFFDCGGVRLMLSRREGSAAPERAGLIYYLVADLPAAHRALQKLGVEFPDPPHLIARLADHDLWMAFCRDSEGNVLGLMSEVRPIPG